jgi:transcriptional regulator with XRE-family HTH domain
MADMEINMRKLKRLRLMRAMSQQELADAAGIGRNTVNRLEQGRTGVQGRTLRRLAQALDVDVSELVQIEDE